MPSQQKRGQAETLHIKNSDIVSPAFLLECQNQILKLISRGASIPEIFDGMCRFYEKNIKGSLCTILLIDDDLHVRHAANPSVPNEYVQAIDGACIGPRAGSCGTALYRRAPVFVSDITHDFLWEDFRDLAVKYGLLACGSVPILDVNENVLGTFAVYYREPHEFTETEIERLNSMSGFASITIENSRREERLRLFKSAIVNATDSVLITTSELNLPGPTIIFANPAFAKMTGYEVEEVIGKTPRILQGPKTDKNVLRQLRRNLTQGRDFNGEAVNYRKDGSEFHLELNIYPIYNNDERIITHYVSIQHEITQKKHFQKERDWLFERAQAEYRFTAAGHRRIELLLRVSSTLMENLHDSKLMLERLGSLLVPEFADWYFVDSFDESQAIHTVTFKGDPQKIESIRDLIHRYSRNPVTDQRVRRVFESKAAEFLPEISDDFLIQNVQSFDQLEIVRNLRLKSMMVVPIRLPDKVLGVMTFALTRSEYRYNPEDLGLAQDIADRAATGMRNAQLFHAGQRAIVVKEELGTIFRTDFNNPLSQILLNAQSALEVLSEDKVLALARKRTSNIILATEQMHQVVEALLTKERFG